MVNLFYGAYNLLFLFLFMDDLGCIGTVDRDLPDGCGSCLDSS